MPSMTPPPTRGGSRNTKTAPSAETRRVVTKSSRRASNKTESSGSKILGIVLSAIILGGVGITLFYFSVIRPEAAKGNLVMVADRTIERDATDPNDVPQFPDDLFDLAHIEKYEQGNGLELNLRRNKDPKNGFQAQDLKFNIAIENPETKLSRIEDVKAKLQEFQQLWQKFVEYVPFERDVDLMVDLSNGSGLTLQQFTAKRASQSIPEEWLRQGDSVKITAFMLTEGSTFQDAEAFLIPANTKFDQLPSLLASYCKKIIPTHAALGKSSIIGGIANIYKQAPRPNGRLSVIVTDSLMNKELDFYEADRELLLKRNWPALDEKYAAAVGAKDVHTALGNIDLSGAELYFFSWVDKTRESEIKAGQAYMSHIFGDTCKAKIQKLSY